MRLKIIGEDLSAEIDQTEANSDTFTDFVFHQLLEYVEGRRFSFDVEFDLSGCTPFQQRVLAQLRRIPCGEVRTYKEISMEITGSSNSARAVGSACNKNPIHIIIPCHRVVGSCSALIGYAAGVATKSLLLKIESTLP